MSLSLIDTFNGILDLYSTDHFPFGTSKHSFPLKIGKYWFNLTVNSDPWITKTSKLPN